MLTWNAVLGRRLARHQLLSPAPRAKIVDVASRLCGIHAQVMPSAEISLGLRLRGFTAEGLEEALWERRVLAKIYGIRGTVHLVPACELGWWLAALRATGREDAAMDARRLAYLGLSERELRRIGDAIAAALVGTRLTREELGAAVGKRIGRSVVDRTVGAFGGQWPVWTAALGHAALAGDLMFGPPVGGRVTFVRPDEWVGRVAAVDPDTALRELCLRWLTAYGPASMRDFAQWANLDPRRARSVRERLGDAVETVSVDGTPLLQVAGEGAPRSSRASTILLPRFDAYAVGSYPRDVVVPPAAVARASATGLLPSRSGSGRAFLCGPMPVLLVDGAVAGIWESKRTAKSIAIRVQSFTRLDRARREDVARAAERIGKIVGLESSLAFGAIATRPHL